MDDHAAAVLAASQGVATLANAFGEEEFIRREVRQLYDWLASVTHGAEATAARPTRH